MRRLGFLLALVLLAGCGGEDRLSKEAYQAEVRKVGTTLGSALGGIDTNASGDELAQAGKQVEGLQVALRKAADDLDELSPPEEVEGAHTKLVQGIRGFADDLEDLGDAIRRNDADAIREFENDFTSSDGVKLIREAAEQLQGQGYSLE